MTTENPNEIRDLMDRLDRAVPPYSKKALLPDSDPMVSAAQRLAQGPTIQLSDSALDRIEARLRARTAELHPAKRPAPPTRVFPRRTRWQQVWRYAAACLIVFLVLANVAQASASSLPGDLYCSEAFRSRPEAH